MSQIELNRLVIMNWKDRGREIESRGISVERQRQDDGESKQ